LGRGDPEAKAEAVPPDPYNCWMAAKLVLSSVVLSGPTDEYIIEIGSTSLTKL
jgi:hypothetical protein